MAATSAPSRSPESERNIARRAESYPSREMFVPSMFSGGPFGLMRRLSEEMDRVFANSLGLSRGFGNAGLWSPPIEVREHDGSLDVTAELPGLKKEDIKVECTDEGILIEGERRQEREEARAGYRHSERSYGHFSRMIPLPPGAETDKAKAEFKDGLLQVHVPIPESKQHGRQIPIAS
ncbi:MAG TPA: Hsp20/alpha crystallin family protein [Bryobacteraceae bacterium]|nr:Hsp20/alpha crystallin family protein [Bryobacteraceae bacterium]